VKSVPIACLGTYYKAGSPARGLHMTQMRGLFYRVKDNNPALQTLKGENVNHPAHPSGASLTIQTSDSARLYVAEIFNARRERILERLGLAGCEIALVPIPSSKTTRGTMSDGWNASRLADALAAGGGGKVRTCVAWKNPRRARHEGGKETPGGELADNIDLIELPPRGEALLYVDDLLTWGNHIAAIDYALGSGRPTAAFTVATTDKKSGIDCFATRLRQVVYDASTAPWVVRVEDMAW
jgi:hypothetical protein